MGKPLGWETGFEKVGTTSGADGVKVGRRVDVGWTMKAAAKVGSTVCVAMGVAVGGGSVTGRKPGERATFAAYTQPIPPGAEGNEI